MMKFLSKLPPLVPAAMMLSVVAMNLLANKELFHTDWVALDCGFVLSWIPFLLMDCVCKVYGGRTAAQLSILAVAVNLAVFLVFKLVSLTPGMWGEYYATGLAEVNDSLNNTIGGSTWIVLGSAFAMATASIINSLVNMGVARLLSRKGESYWKFAARSFTSTAVSQFADNFIFALTVSVPLFGWSLRQVAFCSLTAMGFELLLEICFSGYGYRLSRKWTSGG
ncbi:MAG: VUT family protein [Bacteroidales bacterium]|nr:VUT family protein [Bacteroidales bacterium]